MKKFEIIRKRSARSRIIIYALNFSPELTGAGKYTGEMARWLAGCVDSVVVVTAPPYYPAWKVSEGWSCSKFSCVLEDGVRVLRAPLYVPSRVTALRRILHLLSFAISSFFPMVIQIFRRPDFVVLVAPTLLCAPVAWLVARLSGACLVLHIQDFEVDAMLGLSETRDRRFLPYIIRNFERFLLRRFDKIFTISSGMLARAESKGVDANMLKLFPNWSEVHRFRCRERSSTLLSGLGVESTKKVVLYAGNIGQKQGLEILIHAAKVLEVRSEIFFLIIGDGLAKRDLVNLAHSVGTSNVAFGPLQSDEDFPVLLASVDVHLVIERRGVADAVLPSKLTNILASGGNAVITADSDTTLGRLCYDFPGIATRVTPGSTSELVRGIEFALELAKPNQVAMAYADEYLDKDRILSRFFREALS